METRALGRTGLNIMPLVLGGSVFGWTIDEKQSFAVLDAFVDRGFDAIDTADCYSAWVPSNAGGESESVIGAWLKARPGMREKVTIFTKVGSINGGPHPGGLTEAHILPACDRSLARLGIETIDLYFSHWPDPLGTSYEETLGAFAKLQAAGKVRAIGASNLDAPALEAALAAAGAAGLPAYGALQPEYNLYDRAGFEGALRDLCLREEIGVVSYYGIASGFLSGKYRSTADFAKSVRGGRMAKYLNPRGEAILSALDAVAATHGAQPAEVALAWVMAQPGVTAPISSATRVDHVESFARAAALRLSPAELAQLDAGGA